MTTLGGRDVGVREYLGSSDSTGYMILALRWGRHYVRIVTRKG